MSTNHHIKVEDLEIGDYIYPRTVVDFFYKTETKAKAMKQGKGLVIVVYDDGSVKGYPVGSQIRVQRGRTTF